MASNTIKGAGDIYEKDLYGDLAKSANEALPLMKKLNEVLKATTASNLKLVESQAKDVEGLKKVNEGVNKTNKAFEQKLKLDKETIKLEAKIKAGRTKQAQDNTVLKVQLQAENKARTTLAKSTLKLTGAYAKESAKLNDLRKKYKDLAVSEKGVSKEQKKLIAQITKLDTKLKGIDKTVGQSQRNVGNYGSAFSRAGNALKGFAGALGITAGIAGLSRVITNSIGIFSSFEKANSNLEAVLGATTQEMKLMQEQAKLLGSTTSFTAAEVVGLQTSFAKLGFPVSEIEQMTESTLNAAAAMGSGLDETAALTGATLKAFGLDASEAGRVNDVLAKSTAASALDFAKLSGSMSTIAPVAKSFGFSLEESTSLLGQLANAGFDASSAATATKNILLNLADSNGKLAKSLKEPVKDLPSLVRGLEQLKSEGIDLGEALNLTDKRSVAAFNTFLEGTDSVLALNDSLLNAGGTAQEMADTQLDNLSGSVTILNSAWEGFILSLEDGNGSFSRTLRNIVELATEVLSLLSGTEKLSSEMTKHERVVRKYAKAFIGVVKIIGSLVVAFVTYKGAILAGSIATKAYTAVTTALRIAKVALSGGLGKATKAMKLFNLTTKANPIGLLLGLLALAVTAFYAFRDGANEAAEAQRELNDAQLESKRINEGVLSIKDRFDQINKLNKEQTKNLLSDIENEITANEIKDAKLIGNTRGTAEETVKISKEMTDRLLELNKKLDLEKDGLRQIELQLQIRQQEEFIKNAGKFSQQSSDFAEGINRQKIKDNLEELRREKTITEEKLKNFKKIKKHRPKSTKSTVAIKEDTSAQDAELKRLNDFLKAKEKLENEFQDSQLSDQQQEINDVEDKYFTILQQAVEFGEDTEVLEEARQKALDDIREKYRKKKEKDDADADKKNDNDRQKIADKQAEKDKAEAEQRVAIQQALLSKLEEISAKASQKKIDDLDEQLEASKDNQDRLRELAAKGSLDAQQSISVEAKKQADLKRAKEKEERKQELVSAGFKIFSALLDQGKNPAEAGTETALILGALPAMIEAIPTAFEGTESTGLVSKPLDSNGGRLMLLHDNERVMTEKQNNKMGGIGNDEAANIIEKYNMGELFNYNTPDVGNNLMSSINLNGLNKGLERKIDTLNESIKAIKMPKTSMEADYVRQILKVKTVTGNKIVTETSKLH